MTIFLIVLKYMQMEQEQKQPQERVIKVQSVAEARRKVAEDKNRYLKKWGLANWSAAILTAYQNGSYEDLKANLNIPVRWVPLLMDAYNYKFTEEELRLARASSAPYMKKQPSDDYWRRLTETLEGKR